MISLVAACDADFIVLTETWLSPDISDTELFPLYPNFRVYRCDRSARRGGGVLLAIKNQIPSRVIPIITDLEVVWVYVATTPPVIVAVCYRPPDSDKEFVTKLYKCLSEITTKYPNAFVTLFGDFNYPNIDWSALSSSCALSQEFIDFCLDFNFSNVITQPTRITNNCSNILDLCLSQDPSLFSNISYLPGISDHLVIDLTLSLSLLLVNHITANSFVITRELITHLSTRTSKIFITLSQLTSGKERLMKTGLSSKIK